MQTCSNNSNPNWLFKNKETTQNINLVNSANMLSKSKNKWVKIKTLLIRSYNKQFIVICKVWKKEIKKLKAYSNFNRNSRYNNRHLGWKISNLRVLQKIQLDIQSNNVLRVDFRISWLWQLNFWRERYHSRTKHLLMVKLHN